MHISPIEKISSIALAASITALTTSLASAQVVNPAQTQNPPEKPTTLEPSVDAQNIPTTVVSATRVSEYREEDRVGPYGQPSWTAYRRFPSTRVYVAPPGHVAFEYWSRPTIARHGPTEIQTQYEVEIGLPGRFQLDLYAVHNQTGNAGNSGFNEQKFEVRYALADWDEIPLNPTLYFEIDNRDTGGDVLEYKLLLGGELRPSWHWGANLVYEAETGGELTHEHEVTLGLSHTLQDERFSLGGELKTSFINTHDDRGDFEKEFFLGPSLQYRPLPKIHIDFAPLIGFGGESPFAQIFFVIGYEF